MVATKVISRPPPAQTSAVEAALVEVTNRVARCRVSDRSQVVGAESIILNAHFC
jgi:hypothetical protein